MSNLVLFSIGPVQEFIASARRSRDLWFGSWLLSEVSKTVARVIHEQGGDLIFPAPNDPSDDLKPNSPLNVANKILAELRDNAPSPAKLAELARAAIKVRLVDTIWDQALNQIDQQHYPIDKDSAKAQIADLIEVNWVSVPLGEYAASRQALEHLLAARKATRSFGPVGGWSQPGRPKSSLDGLRESVINERAYDNLSELELYRQFGVRRGERLCGVGLLKRHGQRQDRSAGRVFSTSHVAALPLLERLQPKHSRAITDYVSALQRLGLTQDELGKVPRVHPFFGDYDGHLLFKERLSEYLADDPKTGGEKPLTKAQNHLKLLLKTITGSENFTPLPYYALLAADGDAMGQTIEAQATKTDHQGLSRQLNKFARSVPDLVEQHQGSLVYAGGDDVLAFVPLHTALQCARSLHDRFAAELAGYGYEDPDTQELRHPTLSVGIAITHHLEPLSDALELARAAERKAKEVPGKDALAVTVSKRSGEDRTVVGRWQQQTALGALDARLRQFAELYARDALPDGFAYELAQLHYRLQPVRNPDLAEALKGPMIDAAHRILDRKRTDQAGQKRLEQAIADDLSALIGQLSLDRLADELVVARMFASALRQTRPSAVSTAVPTQLEVQP